ncbi:MAG: TA system VapC family ribonuclease toxin [Thermomicrobiales bacterium]
MTRYLPDVNVLVALIDGAHEHFERAQRWFLADQDSEWIISPLVQLGVIRVGSNPAFGPAARPHEVVESLRSVLDQRQCTFVADDLDALDPGSLDHRAIATHNQVTDVYLVALAARHGAALATFDRKILTSAVISPAAEVYLIP